MSKQIFQQVNKGQYNHKKGVSYFNFVYKATFLPFLNTKYCGKLMNSTVGSRKQNNFFHVWFGWFVILLFMELVREALEIASETEGPALANTVTEQAEILLQ